MPEAAVGSETGIPGTAHPGAGAGSKSDGTTLETAGEGPMGGITGLETDAEREAGSTGGLVGDAGPGTVFSGCPSGSTGAEISAAGVAEGAMGSGRGTEEADRTGGTGGIGTEPDEDAGSGTGSEGEAGFTEESTGPSSLGLDTAVPREVEPERGAETGLSGCEEGDTEPETRPTGTPGGDMDSESGFIIGPAVAMGLAARSEGGGGFTGELAGAGTALSREVVTESGTGAKIGVSGWEERDSGPDPGHNSGAAGPEAKFTGGRGPETGAISLPGGPSGNNGVEAGLAGAMRLDLGPGVDFTGSTAGASSTRDEGSTSETLGKEAGISELEIGAKGVTG